MEDKIIERNQLEKKLKEVVQVQYEQCDKDEMTANFFNFFTDMLYSRGIQERVISLLKIAKEEEMNLFEYLTEELHSFRCETGFNSYRVYEDYINSILERNEYVQLHSETLKEVRELWV